MTAPTTASFTPSSCSEAGGCFEVQRNRSREHLDVTHLFGRRVEQHVAVLRRRAASAPGLEEVLHADADLAFDAADRLLQHACKNRIGLADLDRVLKTLFTKKHGSLHSRYPLRVYGLERHPENWFIYFFEMR